MTNYAHKTKVLLSALTLSAMQGLSPALAACVSSLIQMTVTRSPLNFGEIVECGIAGTVTIDPKHGNATVSGCLSSLNSNQTLGQVRVIAGQAKAKDKVYIRVPNDLTISGAGDAMRVDHMALDKGAGRATVTLNGHKTGTYDIGGTLNVKSAQPAGHYSGIADIRARCD